MDPTAVARTEHLGRPARASVDEVVQRDFGRHGIALFNCLRGLARQRREHDRDLRADRRGRAGAGLRAVGVPGDDLDDTLFVLRALQPALPDAGWAPSPVRRPPAAAAQLALLHERIADPHEGVLPAFT